jgi:hypothetical protein
MTKNAAKTNLRKNTPKNETNFRELLNPIPPSQTIIA